MTSQHGLGVVVVMVMVTVGIFAPAPHSGAVQRASGPERPDEAFTVYLSSELKDKEGSKYKAEKVKKEVEKRIKNEKHWFIIAKSPEKADIFVEVVRHTVNERMRHKMVARVNQSGNGKDWVTETWAQEQHEFEVRVDVFGTQKLVTGEDVRESGGSMKRAAENLAKNLVTLCRENYEEFSRLRR